MIGDGLSVQELLQLKNTGKIIDDTIKWLDKELPVVSLQNLCNWKYTQVKNIVQHEESKTNSDDTIEYNIASDDDTTQLPDVEHVMKLDQKPFNESNCEAQKDFYGTKSAQNNKQWTQIEDLHITKLWEFRYSTQWENGKSKRDIAKSICEHLKLLKFERSENAVYTRINKLLFRRNCA